MAKERKNGVNAAGKILGPVVKAEMAVVSGIWNVASFFGLLPILNAETSGAPKNAFERIWSAGFEGAQNIFGRTHFAQARLFRRLGLVDTNFTEKVFEDHGHNVLSAKPEEELAQLIAFNEKGVLGDAYVAKNLGYQIGWSSRSPKGAIAEKAADKMVAWALAKAGTIADLPVQEQKDLATALARIFSGAAKGGESNDAVVLSVRTNGGYLCTVFKGAVNENGQPLAVYDGLALPVDQMRSLFLADKVAIEDLRRIEGEELIKSMEKSMKDKLGGGNFKFRVERMNLVHPGDRDPDKMIAFLKPFIA